MSPVIEMIKKRNGQLAPFDKSKIVVAVKKSFEEVRRSLSQIKLYGIWSEYAFPM
jgi:anaerobic ribonucleoside-triphosphate reductase